MKRAERHHLKANPLAVWVAETTEWAGDHGRQITYGAVALVAIFGLGLGYLSWQRSAEAQADAALGAALAVSGAPVMPAPAAGTGATDAPETDAPPPAPQPGTYASEQAKLEAALPGLLAVADQYPDRDVATAAAYYSGATLAGLGRLEEATAHYQDAAVRDPQGLYGEMAQMGLASIHLRRGEADQAIAIYQSLSAAADTQLPVDGLLLQLARAYATAGKTDDAARSYQRIVDEYPQSVYLAEARQALDQLQAERSS